MSEPSSGWSPGGRGRAPRGPRTCPTAANRGPVESAYPEYHRPGRFAATDAADDEDFLRQVRERAEEPRRCYRAEKKKGASEDE